MTLSVRLDAELDRLIRQASRALARTKSEVVKASLREYCQRVLREGDANPYALIADLLGRAGSGRGDLSVHGRKYLIESLHAKRRRRSG